MVIVFDLTKRRSFTGLSSWIVEVKDNRVDLIYIIGNKADLADQGDQREVTQAEA